MRTIKILLPIFIVFLETLEVGAENYPPVVKIQSPASGSKFKLTEKINFRGKATDLEDGELSGKSFIWSSDLDGVIGHSKSFGLTLSEGFHIIILRATDSERFEGKDSVFITVGSPKIPQFIEELEPNKPKIEEPKPEKPKPEEPKVEKTKIEKEAMPSLEFLEVPAFGSSKNLKGRALNANPKDFVVVVYIMKDAVWWSKPSVKNPITEINADGTWICHITTEKGDSLAIKIAAYLIPANYKPPVASGDFLLPKELEKKSISKIDVTRKITTPGELLKLKGKSEAKKPEIKKNFVPFVYQMYEKYLLIIRDKQSLTEDAGPLGDNQRREIKNWLAGLNFQGLPLPKREDFEECRGALVEFLENTPRGGFQRGYEGAKLSQKFMLLLVDFEIDGRTAREDGHAQLAESIDALLNLGRVMLLLVYHLKPKELESIRPVAKFFVEYLAIYLTMDVYTMLKPGERPVIAQAALLAIQPSQLEDPVERKEFLELHQALLLFSDSLTNKKIALSKYSAEDMICRILEKFKITDEEIAKAGGEKLLEIVRTMRKR